MFETRVSAAAARVVYEVAEDERKHDLSHLSIQIKVYSRKVFSESYDKVAGIFL